MQRLFAGFTSVGDHSLRPLAELPALRSLWISNTLPREDFAWLAGRLPQVDCLWFPGYAACGDCPRCHSATQVMLTGKGAGILCRNCDQAKFARLQAEYDVQVAASARQNGGSSNGSV